MSCLNFFLLNIFISLSFSYHVVNIPKTWNDAETFCKSQCNSNLASIHSIDDFNTIIQYLILWGLADSWIGLRLLHNTTFNWSDNTPFDFGNELNQGIPWILNEPSGDALCIEMRARGTNNGTWNDIICNNTNTFICNECIYNDFKSLPTYYVSPNRFYMKNARTYCNDHCNSELASIHSENEHNIAMHLAINGAKFDEDSALNVQIGLYSNSASSALYWFDKSAFDYGNITLPQGIYPWDGGEPDVLDTVAQCVQMKYNSIPKYMWNTCDTNEIHRFMCNTCDGELNKYVVIHSTKANYTDAETYCNTYLGTSLASIHNEYDYNLAKTLCTIANTETHDNITSGCLIGLNKQNNGLFVWNDGTEVDFGRDTKDTSIWVDGDDTNCVAMSNDNDYKFQGKNCNESSYFLCNIPSLLCTESDWNTLIGNHSFNNCVMYSDSVYSDNVIVSEKQWINYDNLMIEYIFKIISMESTSNSMDISSGIMLFHTEDSICDYHYISINPTQNTMNVINHQNNIDDLLISINVNITFKLNTYYILKIITDYNQMYIYLNDNAFSVITDIGNVFKSGYIGIRNRNVYTESKSLYISGASFKMNDTAPILCTMNESISTIQPILTVYTGVYTTTHVQSTHKTTVIDDNNSPFDAFGMSSMFIMYTGGTIGCFLILCLCLWLLTVIIKQQRRKKRSKPRSKRAPMSENDKINLSIIEREDEDDSMIEMWLKYAVQLPQYYSLFTLNGFNSIEQLKMINNEQELKEMGIDTVGHRLCIMTEIERLHQIEEQREIHLDKMDRKQRLSLIYEDEKEDDHEDSKDDDLLTSVPHMIQGSHNVNDDRMNDKEALISDAYDRDRFQSDCDVINDMITPMKKFSLKNTYKSMFQSKNDHK